MGSNFHSAQPMAFAAAPIELSVVVPTFKEAGNVTQLVDLLEVALQGIRWEVIFVDDDSPDDTAELVRQLAQQRDNVRCVQRIGRRGLTSACVEGILASASPIVAVMDGDLQHDEGVLPEMFKRLNADAHLEIVVGSRYVQGGSVGDWDATRASISTLATRLSHLVVPRGLQDPMSGFFMIRRSAFMACVRNMSAMGFKILVDLFASSPKSLNFVEVPFKFRTRHTGESKLDTQVAWDYLMLLIDKTLGRYVPARFVSFAIIGGAGVIVHMSILMATFGAGLLAFGAGQAMATVLAMTFNFAVNNFITYSDRRLKGRKWFMGLLSFMLACSVGAVANVGVANFLFVREGAWVLAALAGIGVGAVWNYALTSVYTWGRRG